MLVYNILFLFVLTFLFLNNITRNKNIEKVFLFLIFLAFILLSGFRFDISSDYKEYKYIFEKINDTGNFTEYFIEFGFLFLNKIIGYFTTNFTIFLFSIAIVSIGCKFYFINSVSKEKILSTLLILSFYLLLYDMGAIRRGIALGFSSISILYYLKDKILPSILFLFIASLFHSSALILFPFLFVKPRALSGIKFIILIIFSYFLQYAFSNFTTFQFLGQSNNPIVAKAFGYFESGDYFSENNSFSIGFILRIILVFFLIKSRDQIIIKTAYLDKLLYLYSISILILIIFDKLRIFSSVAIYFKFLEVVLIPILLTTFSRTSRYLMFILLIVYLYFSFYKLINNPLEKDYFPYQSIFD